MEIIEEDNESITAYFTAEELIDGDKIYGMSFNNGVRWYLARRLKDGEEKKEEE